MPTSDQDAYDLFIIGGGVNGCGIARDAAGRGLSVAVAEQNDLASATSGASTKLFHGGLRYIEHFEFRLVREALTEREVLLRAMPHISWPMRFVLPYDRNMRFNSGTPTSKLLSAVMPWTRGRRPAWLIRLGLFLYDHIGGREVLPGTSLVNLAEDPAGVPLLDRFRLAYEYSDCWIDDARLVVLNARDAALRGAKIMTRTEVIRARCSDGLWTIDLETNGARRSVRSRMLVNAAGPWVGEVIRRTVGQDKSDSVRLVRGSHIVTRRLFEHDKCYFLQGTDGRIIFAIPYESDFTLIGTTDIDHEDPSLPPACTDEEAQYLLEFASRYLKSPLVKDDIVWTYSGVRSLRDDGASSASSVTRDYVLAVDDTAGAPLLNVFGGKITTYRRLAEAALDRITACLGNGGRRWTSDVPLPGGDFPFDGAVQLIADLRREFEFLDERWAQRFVRTYGTEARQILSEAERVEDLGKDFGATITAAELDWAVKHEWVRCAEDFLWRRTKLGLRVGDSQAEAIDVHIRSKLTAAEGKSEQMHADHRFTDRGNRPESATIARTAFPSGN